MGEGKGEGFALNNTKKRPFSPIWHTTWCVQQLDMKILLGNSIRLPLAPGMEVLDEVSVAVLGAGRASGSKARVSGAVVRGKVRKQTSTANILA